MESYDIIIIGAGPAGMSAAIYAARYKLKTLVFGELIGGMASEAYEICNFISYKKISGIELAQRMEEHVKSLGVEIKAEKVLEIQKKGNSFEVRAENDKYIARVVILAMGTKKRKLNVENEDKLLGKGISYCATCDAAFFKDKVVGVIGGGDAALTAALLLSEFANKVYIIYRRGKFFRAEPTWVELVNKNKKIETIFNRNVVEIIGKERLEAAKLDSGEILKLKGLFIEIGSIPNIELAKKLGVELDNGYIKVDEHQRTNIDGIYAAGDITNNFLKQIIVAAAEGAVASTDAYNKIRGG